MADSIILSLPDDIATSVREIAKQTNQTVEDVVIAHLKNITPPLPSLPQDIQDELSVMPKLSDDALWTIARDQMPENAQSRAQLLMSKSTLTEDEQAELDKLVERADKLMLRKAEAASILRQRRNTFYF